MRMKKTGYQSPRAQFVDIDTEDLMEMVLVSEGLEGTFDNEPFDDSFGVNHHSVWDDEEQKNEVWK